jgi:hypothetical protein
MILALARWLCRLGAAGVLGVVGPMTVYVVGLVAGAAYETIRRRPTPSAASHLWFNVLIPAHNEATTIEQAVRSLSAQNYPTDRFAVHVVADNCTDETAARARAAGARVHERHDTVQRGKGFALAWLIDRVRTGGVAPDAWLILDADTVAPPDLLARLAARLAAGAPVVQARYDVLEAERTWSSDLRAAALALVHHVRPLGKRWYGGSAGLKGNGMAFKDEVLRVVPWEAASLAEDVEHHLRLLVHGYRVVYAPEARVRAEMPTTLHGAQSQNERWEAGRLAMVRQRIPGTVAAGLQRRDIALLDAAAEQLVPPLAALVALTGCGLVAALLGRSPGLARWLGACGAGQALYTIGGLALTGAPPSVWLALLRAPVYVAWKAWLYCRVLVGYRPGSWVRTERPAR